MAIGRPISLTPNIATKSVSATATADQTSFTVEGGYRINELGVYRNGVRLVQGKDFTASDGSSVTLLSGATVGDILDFYVLDSFNVADAINTVGDQTLSGELTATGGFNIGISSAGTLINTDSGPTGISSINFVGTGNTLIYNSGTNSVDVAIAGGGGGGVGTAINYADGEKSPFTFIDAYQTVDADLNLDATNAGASTSFVVSVVPNVEVSSGVAVTVGSGKTMVIDVLQIGEL